MYEDKILVALMSIVGTMIVILFIIAIVFMPLQMTAESKCKALGWKNSSVTWDLIQYCHRQENEYDITKPLSELTPE